MKNSSNETNKKNIEAISKAGEIYTKEYFQEKGRKGAKSLWSKLTKEQRNARMQKVRDGLKKKFDKIDNL